MTATNQDTQNCGFTFAGMLRRVWPAGTAKRAAQAADTSHRTVENWIAGRASPSIETVWKMIERDARLREELSQELAALEQRLHQGTTDDNASSARMRGERRDGARASDAFTQMGMAR